MNTMPQPNGSAAEFTLPDREGHPVKLSDYRGKNIVLVFYPADWSPVCATEIKMRWSMKRSRNMQMRSASISPALTGR